MFKGPVDVHFFLCIKKVKVYADLTRELPVWSAKKRYRAGASWPFLVYVSEACVCLDVSKGTALCMCWSVWPTVSALCVCVFPANGKKISCIYWTGMEGITWDSKTTKFGFLQVLLLPSGKSHDVFAPALSPALPRLYIA